LLVLLGARGMIAIVIGEVGYGFGLKMSGRLYDVEGKSDDRRR